MMRRYLPHLWVITLFFGGMNLFAGAAISTEEKQAPQLGMVEEQTGKLAPGETFTYRGVTCKWLISGQPKEATGPFGLISINSDQGNNHQYSLEIHPVETDLKYSPGTFPRDVARWEGSILIDEVFLVFKGAVQIHGPEPIPILGSVSWWGFYQPQHQVFDSQPHGEDNGILLVLSSLTPVHVDGWLLSISQDKVPYPDGQEYNEMIASNSVYGITSIIPAVPKNKRGFGRFTAEVGSAPEGPWNITYVRLYASPDLTIQGGDTYVTDGIAINDGETLGAFLDRMSKQYGFEVEWVEYPGHPESVEFMKNLFHPGTNKYEAGNELLSQQMLELAGQHTWFLSKESMIAGQEGRRRSRSGRQLVSLTWPDAKTLRVETVNYDRFLSEAEQQQINETESARAKEEWERDYSGETRVYQVHNLTPVTAKVFIDKVLHVFALYEHKLRLIIFSLDDPPEGLGPYDLEEIEKKIGKGTFFKGLFVEQCVADDKANAVIVTAIPATHKRIEELLAKMEGMITKEAEKGAVKQYRLEVTLLRGAQPAPPPLPPNTEPPASQPASQVQRSTVGESKGLQALVTDMSFPNMPLTEVTTLLRDISGVEVEIARSVDPDIRLHYTLKTPKTIRQVLDDLAELYSLRVDTQPDGSITLRPRSEGRLKAEDINERTFLLQYVRPSEIVELVRQVLSNGPQADVLAKDGQHAIVVRDTPEALARVEDLLKRLDVPKPSEGASAPEAGPQSEKGDEFKGLNTTIADLSFPDQKLTEVTDLLSTLGGVNINVAGDVNPRLRITYLVKTQKTIRQVLDDLGDLYPLKIDYRPDGVFIRSKEEGDRVQFPFVNLSELGISQEDLELFGPVASAELLGRGAVTLIGQPGEEGKTLVALTPAYTCEIQFMDVREPYLIVKGTLLGSPSVERAEKLVAVGLAPQQAIEDASKETGKPLLQNTLYLEGGKPSLLGLTNLREALILLVKWREE